MEYYTIYDLEDNLIAFIDNIYELHLFTGLRIGDINYKFKNKDYIIFVLNNRKFKVYKFI